MNPFILIIILALGLAGISAAVRLLHLWCTGNGLIERRPWEE